MSAGFANAQKPLAGAILCCTSIAPEQRSQLASAGSQMGATIKLDLTSDVTHLIVGNINSAKYRYVARSREDVKVLSPQWLGAMRALWMEGEDVDVAALETEYRLPAFFGLKICLTGFDNPEQRKLIQESIVQQGAEYHGDLTKSVTHLIAAAPSGKKYDHARSWKMKIVSWEWFKQSMERGMALDEAYYDPRMPVEERGRDAWDRKQSMSPALGKRTRDAMREPVDPLRRKLRRSASSKFGSQSEALWAGITAASFERQQNEEDDWTEEITITAAATAAAAQNVGVPQEDLQAMRANEDVPQDDVPFKGDPTTQSRRPLPFDQNDGIFEGRIVFSFGFDETKTKILREALDSNGATVVRDAADLNDFSLHDLTRGYLVIPHDVPIDPTSLPGGAGKLSLVTNWWVERCLHGKSLVDPTANLLCKPFDKLSISGFENLAVHITAFCGIELLHVTKTLALMGAKYDENLSPKTSVMVCNSRAPNPGKLKFVEDKRIPAVHASWLWECIRTGELQPFDDHSLNTTTVGIPKSREAQRPSLPEVPTARLSEEDSFKLHQKKAQTTRHPLKSRSGLQHPKTLALTVSANHTPASTRLSSADSGSTYNPAFDQSEPIAAFDGPSSLPLQDITPSVNSPRRSSSSSGSTSLQVTEANTKHSTRSNSVSGLSLKSVPAVRTSKSTKEPTPDSVIPPDSVPARNEEQEKDYSSIMSALLSNRKIAPNPAEREEEKRKRRRQLGRAQSTRSNPSTSEDILSRTSSLDITNRENEPEEREGKKTHLGYQPSQELGWEAPGAQAAREQMIRAMGGKLEEETSVMEGIGVVKDAVRDIGGLTRTRKRRG